MARYGKHIAVTLAALAAGGCDLLDSSITRTQTDATIEIGGQSYTSSAVMIEREIEIAKKAHQLQDPHGRVLTFRLADNRVLVLAARSAYTPWWCADRLDGTTGDCSEEERAAFGDRRHPDGYIFDDADNPTRAIAFQFEPKSEYFRKSSTFTYTFRKGRKDEVNAHFDVEHEPVHLASFARSSPYFASGSDTLDRDFPSYNQIYGGGVKPPRPPTPDGYALSMAGNNVRIPGKEER